jgi:dUTP pyrophosphatase
MNKILEINIKSVNKDVSIPSYETSSSAGLDLRAYLPEGNIQLKPKEIKLIGTGLYFEIPEGFEVQIRPRSGLAFKNGISVLNSPGTIDADYRGEIKILLINHGSEIFSVEHEMRIAQMVVARYERVRFRIVEELSDSKRGSGGFGSTGIK